MKPFTALTCLYLILMSACREPRPAATRPALSHDLEKGESFLYRHNDSAFYYFNRVLSRAKDSLQVATACNYMAVILADAGDRFGAQEILTTSLRYLHEHRAADRYCLASNYNELGLTSMDLGRYPDALRYYRKALAFSDDKELRAVILNNTALTYQKKGDFPAALTIYRTALPRLKDQPAEQARVLSNLARTRWLADSRYPAASLMRKALRLRTAAGDEWGQLASLSHLSDYYFRPKPDSALYYAGKMSVLAEQLASPDDRLEALEKLIRLVPAPDARRYFTRYRALQDSLQQTRSAARNEFALIRYETEKNKADNLRLQQENTEARYAAARQRWITFAVLMLLGTGVIALISRYRRRRERIEQAAEMRIQQSRLRTSQQVHDVVANGMYRLMNEMEYDKLGKEELLDRMEILYERSRDISYMPEEQTPAEFAVRLDQLLTGFANQMTRVAISGNRETVWTGLDPGAMFDVSQVMQELMVNMQKHSGAASVVLRFERTGQEIHIHYADDGRGFSEPAVPGNGLRSTGTRIRSRNGSINFTAGKKGGLEIDILLPAT